MGLGAQFVRDVRSNLRRTAIIVAVCIFVPMAIVALWVSYQFVQTLRNTEQVSQDVIASIPVESIVAGNIQALECIYLGADACAGYTDATNYLVRVSEATGVTYTPLSDSDPGQAQPDGNHSLTLSVDLTEEQWHDFAAAATLNGSAGAATVNETTVTRTDTGSAMFTIADPAGATRTASMRLSLGEQGLAFAAITYDLVQ